jgi:hypothetical protein
LYVEDLFESLYGEDEDYEDDDEESDDTEYDENGYVIA